MVAPVLSLYETVAPFGVFFDRLHFRFQLDLHALLDQRLLQFGGNFFIFERNDPGQSFEQGDFRAEGAEDRSELDADCTAADHDHRFGNFLQAQNFAVGENDIVIDFDAGQRTRLGTGGEQNVRGFQFGNFSVFFDGDFAWSGDLAPAGNRFHFVFLEQRADAAGVFLNDFVFAGEDRRPINLHVFHFEAKFLGALEVVINISVMQENLGRDAADMQASAAKKRILLDHGNFQSPLRGANRGHITARTAPDYDQVVFSQTSPPGHSVFPSTFELMHGRVFRIAALPGEQTNDFSSQEPQSQPRSHWNLREPRALQDRFPCCHRTL